MFTGIIEDLGSIGAVEKGGGKWVVTVNTGLDPASIREGDSIAVDGVCLTATSVTHGSFSADVSLETLRLTTLINAKVGKRVNVERAMRADGRFGGHIVMGHIDGIGTIVDVRKEGESNRLTVRVSDELARYIVVKGSVAIDGISLTVNNRHDNTFTVNIIPYTSSKTTLTGKSLRDSVNIETDILGKYAEQFLVGNKKGGGINMDFLYTHGYTKGE